ncbi:MAG: hypothetical protein ACRDJE_27525 [Dehalococcoidia bacterium]
MAAPFIFIGTYTLKEDKLEDFTRYCQEFCEYIQANEPRLLYFGFCIDEDGTEVSVVQVHPDADSMAFHMQLIAEHMEQVFDFLDTTKSVQIYGAPSAALVEQIKQFSEPGVPVIVKPEVVGFNRFGNGDEPRAVSDRTHALKGGRS